MITVLSLGDDQSTQDTTYNKLMAKKQAKGKTQAPKPPRRPPTSKTNIGRPEDDELETFFMRKLRSGKLQAISAESEAEIECHQFEDSAEERGEEGFGEEKVRLVTQWFLGLDAPRFQPLWQSFLLSTEQWQFKEIETIADFPEFLFCDECDLCYVLHSALTSRLESLADRTDFANDQLLFLELLCFAARDQISFRVLKSIEISLPAVLALMEPVKAAVLQCSKDHGFHEEGEKANPQTASEEIPRELRRGEVRHTLQKVEGGPDKSRKIGKKQREGKRRGRPSKRDAEVREEQLLKPEQLEQVAEKLIAHIVRSYAYIYPAEARKKQRMNVITLAMSDKAVDCIEDPL